jgi:hypothetical protein
VKADLPQGGEVGQPAPEVEVPGVVHRQFGPQAAPFRRRAEALEVLFEIAVLVADAQRGHHALGDHARAKAPRRLPGHPAIKDQLHPVGPTQIQVLANEILEQQPAAQRTIQHVREAELGLQDGQLVAIPRPAVSPGKGMGQALQPLAEGGEVLQVLRHHVVLPLALREGDERTPWSCTNAGSAATNALLIGSISAEEANGWPR